MSEDPTLKPADTPATSAVAQAPKTGVSSTMILTVVIAFLVGIIIAMNLSQRKNIVQNELLSARSELASKTATINAERARQGLAPLDGVGMESPEQIASRLTKDAATLANYADRFRSMLVEKDQAIAEKNSNLLTSEQARQALSSQLAKVQNQLDQSLGDRTTTDVLRAQLQEARSNMELYANRPTIEQWQAAQSRIADLEAQLANAASQPSAIATPQPEPAPTGPVKLFAETSADLLPTARSLFQALNDLEDKSDLEISAAYNRFATQFRASFLKEIRFPAGSAQLNPADQIAIAEAIGNLPEGAMVLVVGYASTTGNADANRKLSSDRATVVAGNIDISKPGSQAVQAVFLGQTTRFSSRIPERNQVCEIWQINPQ